MAEKPRPILTRRTTPRPVEPDLQTKAPRPLRKSFPKLGEIHPELATNADVMQAIEKSLTDGKPHLEATRLILAGVLMALARLDELDRRLEGVENKVSALLKDSADGHASFRGRR